MTDINPIELEASDAETVEVTYKDQTYTFPSSLDDADGDVIDAMDDRKLSHALRGLMAEADWERFKKTKPKVSDYGGLFDAFARAIGLTEGE
jgi:hypothetical protein